MKVLVTGGTGFIGSHTAVALVGSGHDVRLLVRSPEKAKRVFQGRGCGLPELMSGDIAEPDSVDRALAGCDAVVHAAALVALEKRRAREVMETNTRGIDAVVGRAAERGLRVVYVSSIGALFRPGIATITADSPVASGRSAYARSKARSEQAVRELQERGAPIQTTYPTAVVGPDDPGLSESNHAIRTFLGTTMVLTDGGFQLIDVRDLARVHVRLLEGEAPSGRSLVGGHYFDWAELADRIDGVTGDRVRRIRLPAGLLRWLGSLGDGIKRFVDFDFPLTREAMDFATHWQPVDDSRTRHELSIDWRPPEETLGDTIRWLVRAGHLESDLAGGLRDTSPGA